MNLLIKSLYFNKKGICGLQRWLGTRDRIVEERYYIGEGIRGKSAANCGFNAMGKIRNENSERRQIGRLKGESGNRLNGTKGKIYGYRL